MAVELYRYSDRDPTPADNSSGNNPTYKNDNIVRGKIWVNLSASPARQWVCRQPNGEAVWEEVGSDGGDANTIHGRPIPDFEPGDLNAALVVDDNGDLVWRPFPGGNVLVFDVTDPAYAGGAKGDGVTNDAPAFQAAINAAISSTGSFGDPGYRVGGIVYVPRPASYYRINNTITIQNCKGLRICSDTNSSTRVIWHGAAGQPMFLFDGAYRCQMGGFWLASSGSNIPSHAIKFVAATAPGEYVSDDCLFFDMELSRGGVDWDYAFEFDTNSGRHYFDRIFAAGYNLAGLLVRAGASIRALRSGFIGSYNQNAWGLWFNGGSGDWQGAGNGFGHHSIDVVVGPTPNDAPIHISMWNSEDSPKGLRVGDPNAPDDQVWPPICIRTSRLEPNIHLAADGRYIELYNNTPVELDCNTIVALSGAGLPARIYMATTHPQPVINLGTNSWTNFEGTGYSRAPTPSGNGTIYHGMLEYPDTWTVPPNCGMNHNFVWVSSAGAYEAFLLPNRIVAVGLGTTAGGKPGRNLALSLTFSGGQQERTFSFIGSSGTNEEDLNYFVDPSIERISGTIPDGLSCTWGTKQTSGFTVRLSEPATGFSVRVNCIVVRYG